jgi:ribosomal protein S18 acetylase RimI-like enzyme
VSVLKARLADLEAVAKLHTQVFPGFFLTSLGVAFLKELYIGFLSHPSGILLVVKENDKIVGFAAGTIEPGIFFSDLRHKRFIAFTIKAIPSILRNPLPVCRKLFHATKYQGDSPPKRQSAALLSSIGVSGSHQGAGVANMLIMEFENEARIHGAEHIYLTTDAQNNNRVNAFYLKQGYVVTATFKQNDGREMFRYEKQIF